ncbi:1,4-dihydroxy-2-naphthoate octaprenyltransferase [Bacteroidia bacterium]|nr:1,4-dihydroxy-2-naphthoate octaprenyltransferase [Bacteroidia bacterium]
MMNKAILIIKALRLYSLMVSSAGIVLGSMLAFSDGSFRWSVAILTILTCWCLHLLCNVSNDYGDAVRQTDKDHYFGDTRYVQEGLLSLRETKGICIVLAALAVIFGCSMIALAFGIRWSANHWLFSAIGLLAIFAAIAYTNGRKPYGYHALGDVSVFIFFGIATVQGAYYLQTGVWSMSVLVHAAAVGLMVVGLLNNNNIRDIEADVKVGKTTVANLLGLRQARRYQYLLLMTAFIIEWGRYGWIPSRYSLIISGCLPFFMVYLGMFKNCKTPADYHRLMFPISMLTLLFAIVVGIAQGIMNNEQ